VYKITSPTKSLTVDNIFFGRSSIKHKDNNGARTVPCGTPEITSVAIALFTIY